MLYDTDLIHTTYTIAELEASIDHLSVKYLLNYQTLTAEFCAKYILNDYCATCQEDTYICTGDVLNKQSSCIDNSISSSIVDNVKIKFQIIKNVFLVIVFINFVWIVFLWIFIIFNGLMILVQIILYVVQSVMLKLVITIGKVLWTTLLKKNY